MKKRTKSYQPKRVAIPMLFMQQSVLDKYPHLPTAVYGQIHTFIERPSVEASNNLSHQIACIAGGMSHMANGAPIRGKRDAGSIAICSAVACMEAICKRFERTGMIAVNDSEAQTLRGAAGRLDEVLQGMPLSAYLKAESECHLWLKEAQVQAEAA
jgi:hypothetical protein